jgi:hypothetical protein
MNSKYNEEVNRNVKHTPTAFNHNQKSTKLTQGEAPVSTSGKRKFIVKTVHSSTTPKAAAVLHPVSPPSPQQSNNNPPLQVIDFSDEEEKLPSNKPEDNEGTPFKAEDYEQFCNLTAGAGARPYSDDEEEEDEDDSYQRRARERAEYGQGNVWTPSKQYSVSSDGGGYDSEGRGHHYEDSIGEGSQQQMQRQQ